MLRQLAVLGGIVGFVASVFELSHRLDGPPASGLGPDAALREAMRGPDAAAVRAEFRRRGIDAPDPRRRPIGFGL